MDKLTSMIKTHRFQIVTYLMPLVVFLLIALQMINLPGLYMDAVNPEYIIAEMLNSENPVFKKWLLPGNVIDGRYPVFSGPMYHGSLQVYATLPFLYAFGVELHVFRYFQVAIGLSIVLLAVTVAKRGCVEGGRWNWIPLAVGVLVATDPILLFGLRTQAYSLLFPLPLLLLSWIILDLHLRRSTNNPKRYILPLFSGLLVGLSVFSYFVYAFFVPVIFLFLILGSVTDKDHRSRIRIAMIWILGVITGGAGFFIGMALLVTSLGGVNETLEWWNASISSQLKVLGDDQNALERILSVAKDFHSVLTGGWLFDTVLNDFYEAQLLGFLKWVLFGLSVYAAFFLSKLRLYKYLLASVLGYLGLALVFGGRLDGHHYTLLVPLVYIGVAFLGTAIFTLCEKANNVISSSAIKIFFKSLYAITVLAVIALNLVSDYKFLSRLDLTGGIDLYSDAINRFSRQIIEDEKDSMVYMPDWGYRMPFAFLTKGLVEYDSRVDPIKLKRYACEKKSVFVVFDGKDNDQKFELIKKVSRVDNIQIVPWRQRNGKTVFEVGKFYHTGDCEDVSKPQSSSRQIFVSPSTLYSCYFFSRISAYVSWNFSNAKVDAVSVYVSEDGKKHTLWLNSATAADGRYTGPWANGGMKFTFFETKNNSQLGSIEITNLPCPIIESQDLGLWARPRVGMRPE